MPTIKVTDATFERDVLQADRPVLVDFWAAWCGPCRAVAPVLEELAEAHQDVIHVAKLDVDANPVTSTRLGVQSIPTFYLFSGGKALASMQGAQPKPAFERFLARYVPALKPKTIAVAELERSLKGGEVVSIFDVRDPRDFARSHLRKARCVAPETLSEAIAGTPAGGLVVLVCRSGQVSAELAARHADGGRRVLALEKGLLEWEGSGKPTYSNAEEAELDGSPA